VPLPSRNRTQNSQTALFIVYETHLLSSPEYKVTINLSCCLISGLSYEIDRHFTQIVKCGNDSEIDFPFERDNVSAEMLPSLEAGAIREEQLTAH
jgi:hypothetical protein